MQRQVPQVVSRRPPSDWQRSHRPYISPAVTAALNHCRPNWRAPAARRAGRDLADSLLARLISRRQHRGQVTAVPDAGVGTLVMKQRRETVKVGQLIQPDVTSSQMLHVTPLATDKFCTYSRRPTSSA